MKLYSILLLGILVNCSSQSGRSPDELHDQALFKPQRTVATLETKKLKEASGLDESNENPRHLWSHNDSGGEPMVYLLNLEGEIVMEVRLQGVVNRDWEEIVTVQKGDRSFIYVAEIGDNQAVHSDLQLIRFEEPTFEGNSSITIPFDQLEIMKFRYVEGARDAEALMFDYGVNELVLITKREENTLVYSFPFQQTETPLAVKAQGAIPSRMFTAADANEKGEILLKNYDSIYYWSPSLESIAKRLLQWKGGTSIRYEPEPQGEAMCWLAEDFYTLSEKALRDQKLLVFERK